MTIVRMTEDLVKQVAEIEKECFASPWTEDELAYQLSKPTARFYVAVENGEALGYIGSDFIIDEAYVTNIAVKINKRKKGIGRQLLDALITDCKNNGASFLSLEVRKSNAEAIRLYEKTGFIKVGERKNFYYSPVEDALLYTLFFKEVITDENTCN
jgi:ribosomal-protein-alanine N-acetyltransferase